jgi:hypothetical protein
MVIQNIEIVMLTIALDLKSQTLLPGYPSTQAVRLRERIQGGNQTRSLETRSQVPRTYTPAGFASHYPISTSLAQYNIVNENVRPRSDTVEPVAVDDWGMEKVMGNNESGIWGACVHRVPAEECSICVWGWA